MLFNEPKLLKFNHRTTSDTRNAVSVLFNEPKLLKSDADADADATADGFSALQRAEIAEIQSGSRLEVREGRCFSALQRAEIAEMLHPTIHCRRAARCFSALQRAEIAEIQYYAHTGWSRVEFQCSSTSRNC